MKKILLLITGCISVAFFSQCTISGPDQLQVGERQMFTAKSNNDTCENCFEWNHLDQKIILETATDRNPLSVKGSVIGEALLSLKIISTEKISKCSKIVKVIMPTSSIIDNSPKCVIKVESIIEKLIAENQVVFKANISADHLPFHWIVFYRNRTQKLSDLHEPTFEFSVENPIDKVELIVGTNICNKKLLKTYHEFFWYFLK